ncbi:hypothetical protein BCR43DRAFT_565270 [Syncephalastrum racemosum]|uniref:Uncharacterized protein n=1 Tax=Syncephalastrum racemosum TaxID=13706 RepID=A0A1X2H6S8_SYNRA|nr:hypothetical protein BCR43DRAFT_565270 [Syncephalastrum racemosum]
MIRHIGKFCSNNDPADSVLQDYLDYCQGTRKKSPIQFALDISTMASEWRGAINLRKRAYYKKLRKTVGNTGHPVFTIGSSFRANGVRLMMAFINWLKHASEDQWRKHPPRYGLSSETTTLTPRGVLRA